MGSAKIVIEQVYKVFGSAAEEAAAMALLRQGAGKDAVLARTGKVAGLADVSLSVDEGEIFVLMGLSGSGKSTLLRMMNGLLSPSAGKVLLDGADVARLSARQLRQLRRGGIGMVFQSFALLPHLTILENAAFGLEIAGVGLAERTRRATAVLEQVGLAAYAGSYPQQLSGGMRQRVGLARALAIDPALLLMDEAFSALDPLNCKEMQEILLRLQSEQRRTIVFVTHDLEEALRLGDRIAIMKDGRLVQLGTARDIIRYPADDYVRAFFKHADTSPYLLASDLIDGEGGAQVHPFAEAVAQVAHVAHVAHDMRLDQLLPQLLNGSAALAVQGAGGIHLGLVTATSVLRKIYQGAH